MTDEHLTLYTLHQENRAPYIAVTKYGEVLNPRYLQKEGNVFAFDGVARPGEKLVIVWDIPPQFKDPDYQIETFSVRRTVMVPEQDYRRKIVYHQVCLDEGRARRRNVNRRDCMFAKFVADFSHLDLTYSRRGIRFNTSQRRHIRGMIAKLMRLRKEYLKEQQRELSYLPSLPLNIEDLMREEFGL